MDYMKKYRVPDILIASPFHETQNLEGHLTTDVFFEHLFCKYDYYYQIAETLDKHLSTKAETHPFIRFFVGYSGTGKTTFLHWYCLNRKDKISYSFLDFTSSTSFAHSKEDGVAEYQYQLENHLRKLLEKILEAKPDQIYDLLYHIFSNIVVFNSHFSKYFPSNIEELFGKGYTAANQTPSLAYFINTLQYSEIFLLLLLFYNRYSKSFVENTNGNYLENDRANLLLVVDNIDGIRMEGYSKLIPRYLINIYEQYLSAINASNYFNKEKKIDFIYGMRDTVYSVINPHDEDYYNVKNIRFFPSIGSTEQLDKRIAFSKLCQVEVQDNVEILMNHLIGDQDKATKNSYMPLFNYNNRKICKYIYEISVENNIFIDSIIDIIKAKNRIGVRGILYFLFIRYMQNYDFFRETFFFEEGIIVEEDGKRAHINIARIMLTSLLTLNKYYLNTEQDLDYSNEAGLFQLYEEYLKIFSTIPDKEKRFLGMISKLFLFHARNWCHLVSISDKSLESEDDFEKEIELLKRYEQIQDNAEKHEIKRKINKMKVRLNSSGYIYLKDIVRHYEFFSIRVNEKPLFASTNLNEVANGNHDFEFMCNLKNTYHIAKNCIESLHEFLKIRKHDTFEQESYCFRIFSKKDVGVDEHELNDCFYDAKKRSGRLYINRIVDFHTEYIDRFRIYILNNEKLLAQYAAKMNLPSSTIKKLINGKIIGFIRKYISLYYIRDQNQLEQHLVDLQNENIKKIFQDAKADKFVLRINSNR